MKFRVFNHRAPANHRLQNVEIDAHADAFARVVITATGGGLSSQATAKAMETSARLMGLPVGGELRVTTNYLSEALTPKYIDVTFARIED